MLTSSIHVVITAILAHYKLDIQSLQIPCNDSLFKILVNYMGSYELLAPHLDIPVDGIQRDAKDDPNQGKIKCFQQWKERKGCEATYLSLAQAFLAIDDRHCAECIVSHAKQLSLRRPSNRGSVFLHTIPSWEDMTTEEKKVLEEELIVENEEVQEKYASCFTNINMSFSTKDIDINHVKGLLLSKLPTAKSKSSPDSTVAQIKSAATMSEIFVIIATLCSWFNYRLLEFIIQKFGNEKEKAMWSEYQETVLKPYLMRSLFQVPSKSLPSAATSNAPAVYLCLKLVDDVELSAKEALLIKKKLSELLEVPVLELSTYDVGSVLLIFAIAEDIFNLYPPESVLHQYIEYYDKDTASYYISANITTIL